MLDLILGPAQQIIAWLIGAAAIVIGVVLNTWRVARKARREGQEQAAEQARRLDHENAAAIRDRTRAVKRVQPGDHLRYRD